MFTDRFTADDLKQIQAKGIALETIYAHLRAFQKGFPPLQLHRPCTAGDGITAPSPQEVDQLGAIHDRAARAGRVTKFVPASGAASRMFQSLLSLANRPEALTAQQIAAGAAAGDRDCQALRQVLTEIKNFAFYDDLRLAMAKDGFALAEALSRGQYQTILTALLTPSGLNYATLPKGLIKFHSYADHTRTPLEEHLVEAAAYGQAENGIAHVHFTVPLENQDAVRDYLEQVRHRYEQAGCRYVITLSVQKPSTDTLAVDRHNEPFRDQTSALVFRPGGHGALLENLNDLQGDIIFVKNIDNVVPDRLKPDTYRYKKALGGYLIQLQKELFFYQERLSHASVDERTFTDAWEFAQCKLSLYPPLEVREGSAEEKRAFLMRKLHRPLRVCGMVKNTGEPGGGPFWVIQSDGTVSLQIVESSQVNMQAADQRAIWAAATHFNPVDLVCGVRDYRGRPFDLRRFTDPDTGFISTKSKDGEELRALELPGLWNGAMADWNTVFIEVPLSTFNPVKTVSDLLRPEHQR
jgi:hypothetical protein